MQRDRAIARFRCSAGVAVHFLIDKHRSELYNNGHFHSHSSQKNDDLPKSINPLALDFALHLRHKALHNQRLYTQELTTLKRCFSLEKK